jgi:hypothetical protein
LATSTNNKTNGFDMTDLSIQNRASEPYIPNDAFLGVATAPPHIDLAQSASAIAAEAAQPINGSTSTSMLDANAAFDVADEIVDVASYFMQATRKGWETVLSELPSMPPGQQRLVLDTLGELSDSIRHLGVAGTISDALNVLTAEDARKEVLETVLSGAAGSWAAGQGVLYGGMLAGPPGAVVGGLVAGFAGEAATEYVVSETYDFLTGGESWGSVSNGLSSTFESVGDMAGTAWDYAGEGWDSATDYAGDVYDWGSDVVDSGLELVSDFF